MEKAEQTSPLYRMAEACAMALFGALVCALPTVLRASSAGAGALDALVTAMAVMLCVLLPLALILPRAARGWRGVVGQHTPRRLVAGLATWIVLCGAAFTVLGTFLKANTHHRGLGGATFGVFAAASAIVLAVLVARGVAIGNDLEERPVGRWVVRGVVGALMIGSLAVIGLPFASAREQAEVLARAAVFDLLLTTIVVSMLLTRRAPKILAGAAKLIALPVALSVVVIGFIRVESAHATTAIRSGGGAVATILGALERWTDRDGDGMGSHFGGKDCDEGNPERRPGFVDAPGDGIDHDCDGIDGAPPPAVAEAQPAPASEPAPAKTAATVVASAPKPLSKPDIIVVTLDTVRADRTTVYGYDEKTTPNLAAFAKGGIVFERAYGAGSDTQRALTPVLSGTTISVDAPHQQGMAQATGQGEHGRRAYEGGRLPYGRRELVHLGAQGPRIRARVRRARRVALADPPPGARVHGGSGDRCGHRSVPEALGSGRSHVLVGTPVRRPRRLRGARGNRLRRQCRRQVRRRNRVRRPAPEAAVRRRERGRAQRPHGVDRARLARRSVRRAWSTGHGMQLYDESLRVPLIIATPWSQPGRYATDAVSILDVAPTVLDLAGAASEDTSGVSLRPVLDGKPFERAPVAAYANRRVVIVDWPLKLYVFRRKDKRDRLLLFDLAQDPGETKDISADDKDNLVRLDEIRNKTDQTSGDE